MDTRTIAQKVNVAMAMLEERRGPAGHSQEDMPILDALRSFHAEDTASFAIPAHKSGMGAAGYAKEALGEQAFVADQTMLNGVDNRHESWEVQTAAQNLVAEALGADLCLFSTNGSTGSVHAAMSAVVGPGEKLAVARNAHCRAVMIVTPSYYGVCSDVPRLAEIAHDRELPFVSDEILTRASAWHFNELHVTMDVQQPGMTGYKAADWLREHHALAVELADRRLPEDRQRGGDLRRGLRGTITEQPARRRLTRGERR